jgi:hypothetical protein
MVENKVNKAVNCVIGNGLKLNKTKSSHRLLVPPIASGFMFIKMKYNSNHIVCGRAP